MFEFRKLKTISFRQLLSRYPKGMWHKAGLKRACYTYIGREAINRQARLVFRLLGMLQSLGINPSSPQKKRYCLDRRRPWTFLNFVGASRKLNSLFFLELLSNWLRIDLVYSVIIEMFKPKMASRILNESLSRLNHFWSYVIILFWFYNNKQSTARPKKHSFLFLLCRVSYSRKTFVYIKSISTIT